MMTENIKVSDETYNRLGAHAVGFESPERVIERLLDHYEGKDDTAGEPEKSLRKVHTSKASMLDRDNTKYNFQGRTYGKGRLVLAIITEYVKQNPDIAFDELSEIFPAGLQGAKGVFHTFAEANEVFRSTGHKRNFIKDGATIQLSDVEIAVSNQWGKGNIDNFISAADSLGFEITPFSD